MGIRVDGPGRVVLTKPSGQLVLALDTYGWCERGFGLRHAGPLDGVQAGLWALRDGRFELVIAVGGLDRRAHRDELRIADVATLLGPGPAWGWAERKVGEAALCALEDAEAALRLAKHVLGELGATLEARVDGEATNAA